MIGHPKRLGCVGLAALLLVSGCSSMHPSPPTRRVIVGAAIGAVAGGAVGCATAAFIDDDHGATRGEHVTAYEIGCPTGLVVGALAGGIIAAETYAPPPAPPPVATPTPTPMPTPTPAPTPPPKEKLVLRGVHFDFDRSDIRPEDEPVLDEAVRILKTEQQVRLYVDGYCDAIGSDDYNEELSAERAASVVTYLENAGISAGRLIPRGFGKTHFVATNDTDEGRAQNRRVELVPAE